MLSPTATVAAPSAGKLEDSVGAVESPPPVPVATIALTAVSTPASAAVKVAGASVTVANQLRADAAAAEPE